MYMAATTKYFIVSFICSKFCGLGPMAFSESELTSENVTPFRHFSGTPWTGDWPIARPLPTQQNEDIYA